MVSLQSLLLLVKTMKLNETAVLPLFISENVSEADNYRPNSFLLAVSEVLEKIIYIRLNKFRIRTKQLQKNKFGCRSKLGSIDALKSVVDSIRYNFNRPATSTVAIFLGLLKFLTLVQKRTV